MIFFPLLLSAAATQASPRSSPSGEAPVAAAESTVLIEGGDELTLSQAFEALRSASPRTAAERVAITQARAEVVAASVLPNPTLDYEGTRLRSGTNTGSADVDTYSLEWPLLAFGQRKARRTAAEQGVGATEAHVDALYAERARQLRVAFDDLLLQQERVGTLDEARADLRRVAAVVDGRQRAGEASTYDALRVETEFRLTDAQLGDARGDLLDARGRVAILLGRPDWSPHASGTIVPANIGPLDASALWEGASPRLPALVSARRDEDAARAATRAARRDAWPVPALTGGVQITRDASSTSAVFGLSLPIPSLDRNQGAIARAAAAEDASTLERAATEAELKADLERAVSVAIERRSALSVIDSGVAAKLPELRSMAEAAYREGRGSILELLDAFRSLTAARLARLDALQGVAHADADVLYLVGRADRTEP